MNNNQKYQLNEDVFLLIKDQKLYLWNCRAHEQFEIEPAYVNLMLNPDNIQSEEDGEKVEELVMTGILIDKEIKQPAWTWDNLSRIFHIGTSSAKPQEFDVDPAAAALAYVEYCGSISNDIPPESFDYSRGETIQPLSQNRKKLDPHLLNLLEKRCCSRTFSSENISFEDISTILSETFRYRNHNMKMYEERGMYTPTFRRSSPSGGSLQSCEAYLIARKVEGIKPGIYHYRSHNDTLGFIADLPENFKFGDYNAGQMFSDDLSAQIVITNRFEKLAWKYAQSRAYRVALLDAGHLSQTAQLVATSLGYLTWLTGMFFDVNYRELLQIDPNSQQYPLLVVGVGTGEPIPFERHLVTETDRAKEE